MPIDETRYLAVAWEMWRRGIPVAHDGDDHGQFHFAGRLAEPLPEVATVRGATAWLEAHPGGALVVYLRDARTLDGFAPWAVQPFRGHQVAIIAGRAALHAAIASASLDEQPSTYEGTGRPRPPR